MSKASDVFENKILDILLNQANSVYSNIYLAAYTTTTNDADGGTEVSGNNYARIEVTSAFPAATGTAGSVSNDATITFAAASGGDWGTVVDVAIHSALSAGDMLWFTPLDASKLVEDGDTLEIAIGNLTVTCA